MGSRFVSRICNVASIDEDALTTSCAYSVQRFYSVYDTSNSRVGLATTEFTTATSN